MPATEMNIVENLPSAVQTILGFFTQERWAPDATTVFAVGAAILALLGIFSRRWMTFLGATLLAGLAFFEAAYPGLNATTLAVGAALGSVLVTLGGIRSRRISSNLQQELKRLGDEIRELQIASDRHFLSSLNPKPSDPHPWPSERGPSTDGSDGDGLNAESGFSRDQ
jgi:hypothetical protein